MPNELFKKTTEVEKDEMTAALRQTQSTHILTNRTLNRLINGNIK